MTPIAVPDDVLRLITTEFSVGNYGTQADVLREAMLALAERREAIAGIQDGLADVEAGRIRPWERFEAEFVARHQIDLASADDS